MAAIITSNQNCMEVLSNVMGKRDERKVPLFINDMIVYLKNPEESIGKY
jgi:hypothetical protein